jgi:hypothetical protein
MRRLLSCLLTAQLVLFAGRAGASPPQIRARVLKAFGDAAEWLAQQQGSTGAWSASSKKPEPSITTTGFALSALASGPKSVRERYQQNIARGAAFLASQKGSDGSFADGPERDLFQTIATAGALTALSASDPSRYQAVIKEAQQYLARHQLKEGTTAGGNGDGDVEPTPEGRKKMVASLYVTQIAAEALASSGLPKDDGYWALAPSFVRACQNDPRVNKDRRWLKSLEAGGLSLGDDGGLYFAPVVDPGRWKAGLRMIGGKKTIASYGAATYAGLSTYLLSGVGRDSPEVKAALEWARKNYAVDRHAGYPREDAERRDDHMALFRYFLTMAQALDRLGDATLTTADGVAHDWASELAEQLLRSMKDGKTWVNDNPKWGESNPQIATAFALSTLEILLKHLPEA